eukprot:TRINITY_DN38942_c0_g1_i1.p1 TRINITY_DN38942_c0_g1~~TRINITY_DN38942_c0_g1_i1.p1  ORF type:complete len:176 (-),score=42.10 TRINITY_DN38942_c0_g1_i1:26-553(-)
MGGALSKKKKAQVLVLGLDNAGKTTMINFLKPVKLRSDEIVPTAGYIVEEFQRHNVTFSAVDMSGQGKFRGLWEHYYKDCCGIIFVVDAADKLRFNVVKEELANIFEHSDVKNTHIPLLFLANKMDLDGAIDPTEMVQLLELDGITGRAWHINATNALTGQGVDDAIRWLAEHLP